MRTPSAALRSPLTAAVAVFVVLAALVSFKTLTGIDTFVYSAIQPLGGATGNAIASAVTLLGRTDVAVAIALIAGIVLLLQRRRLRALAAIAIFTLLPLDSALKSAIGHPRPPAGSGHDLGLLPAWLPKASETLSFPSSHAALAGFLAVLIGHVAPRSRPVVWVLAIAVAISRLYLDKHWASDVVGGLLLGFIVGELAWLIAGAIERRMRKGATS